MDIRLIGLVEECKAALEPLQRLFVVVEIRGPYANRVDSKQVRYFVQTRGPRLCPCPAASSSSSCT